MITVTMPPLATGWRRWMPRRPRVAAVFSYRFDAHLVPDLLANLQPIVDGWVAFDDRAGTGLFTDQAARRRALIGAAREAGADWILGVDPDERFETGTAAAIGSLMRKRGRVAWGFRFRELYAPDRYRVDGLWGEKRRYCLFSVYPEQELTETGLHDTWFPRNGGFRERHCELELYHLKMIAPAGEWPGATFISDLTRSVATRRSAMNIWPTKPAPALPRSHRAAVISRPMSTTAACGWLTPSLTTTDGPSGGLPDPRPTARR